MSRVFRRPMFRGGSTNMNGIMSDIEDRENYAEGTNYSERYKKVFDQYSKPAMDPLSKLLIQGGLRGLSETRGGGTLANMALAFEKPTEQLMSDLQQRKNAERDMALAGLGMDIKAEQSRESRMQEVEDIEKKYQNQVKLQLLKNAQGGDRTAIQKLADQAIELGQFENTPEGRKQAFEYFTLSSGDILRSSVEDRIADYSKTNFPGEDMVGTAKARFVVETLPMLREQGYEVDILKPYVDFFKIGSYEILWKDLFKKCAQSKKPVIFSTGMAKLSEIMINQFSLIKKVSIYWLKALVISTNSKS